MPLSSPIGVLNATLKGERWWFKNHRKKPP